MKRIVLTATAVVAMALAATAASAGGDGAVRIGFADNYFDPAEPAAVSLRPRGPEAVWRRLSGTGEHNVLETQGFFSSGPPGDLAGYRENISAGTWQYYCRTHGSVLGGMAGEVSVAPIARSAGGGSVKVQWADRQAQTGNRYEVEFRRPGGSWKTWVKSTGRNALRFGAGSPLVTVPGEEYEVRARSRSSSDAGRHSGWSPPLSFTAG